MKSLLQIVYVVTFLIASIQALNDDYEEYDDTDPPKDENKYPELAARLNCSALVLHHRGVRTNEVQTNSIYVEQEIEDSRNDISETETDEEGEHDATVSEDKGEEDDTTVSTHEDESTELPTNVTDESDKSTRSRRGVVTSERLWTLDNISIIDGYSKVAFYPIKPVEKSRRVKRMVPVPSENDTMEECTAPFDDDGSEYNWYQIIVNNGGAPGKVNAVHQSPNKTKVLEPCHRPINNTSPPMGNILYDYEWMEFEKVYRHERAFLRFAGTASEFVDIVGQLVWSPPPSPRRYYRVSYRKDDTGLYVNVRRRHKCTFEENPLSVKCNRVSDFTVCEIQPENEALPAGLQASLLG